MGNILLKKETLLTEMIPDDMRDDVITDFCNMYACATKATDKFYAETTLYGDNESPLYRYCMSWNVFCSKVYSKGVSQTSYQLLNAIFVQNPNLDCVENEEAFRLLDEPKAYGGFKNSSNYNGLLVDIATWRKWREEWFCEHQDEVNWDGNWDSVFFLNKDVVVGILKGEIAKYVANQMGMSVDDSTLDNIVCKQINSKSYCHENNDINKNLKDNAVTIFFHNVIMSGYARGGDRQGYIMNVGSEICKANYYVELQDLSAMEKDASTQGRNNTQRSVWGIKNACGEWKFISFDFEKGMFEFHDNSGLHLGEFMFDGTRNADAKSDHSLRCVNKWKESRHL